MIIRQCGCTLDTCICPQNSTFNNIRDAAAAVDKWPQWKIDNVKSVLSEPTIVVPVCDICTECGEHAEFDKGTGESNCCGAGPYDSDPDIDTER
jgi:hypothetical protein